MNARKQFDTQIKQVFTPILQADGFVVNGNTSRRVIGEVIHVLALQGSIQGGQCCICLGIHLGFLPSVGTAAIDPEKIEEPECEFRTRLAPPGKSDAWWNYGATESEARESAESITQFYQQFGAPYFRRFSSFPDDFTSVTPEMFVNGGALPFPLGGTFVRRALALARIAKRVGRTDEARQFAEAGLARVGPAASLKPAFRQIIASA